MAAKDLVTLEEFKLYKNINSTEKDDLISALISRVSAQIKTYCGKTFVDYYSTAKTEYFDGVDVESLFVDEYPIVSVVSITPSLDGGKTFTTALVEFDDFFVNYDTGEITSAQSAFITESTVASGKSNRNLQVVYKGGYKKLPEELRQATMDLIEFYKENEYTPRQDFQSFKIENLGFRAGSSSALPSHIKRVLDMHREL